MKEAETMVIFGRRLSDYIAFSRVFLVLIFVIGVARLALSLGGVPNSTARWLSMTATVWVAVIYYSIRVHTTGFGSYKQLLPVIALLNLTAQIIAIAGIAIAIFTGNNNVFSSPEFAFGSDGKTWTHLLAHVFLGTTVGTLFPWVIGCGFLALTRKLSASDRKVIQTES
jgi:hypothetical protein